MKVVPPPSEGVLRILISRPDRLGDVLLSTPTFEVIKRNYPGCHLTVLVRPSIVPIVRGNPFVDEVLPYDPEGHHAGIRGFFRLLAQMRRRQFRIFLALQSNGRIAAAAYLARVRYRVGPLSKPHSFLAYNRGVRQRRSHVEMHEADYNLQLLRRMGIRVGSRQVPTRVSVTEETLAWARKWFEEKGWGASQARKPGAKLVAIHPGMGGSALNWPETHYVELIRALSRDGVQVVVTGGALESTILERYRSALGTDAQNVWFYGGKDAGPIDDLAGILSQCDAVVAPSTGPLHLAVALGKPVVTFYPPIRVQSALRWGPYLADDRRASVLTPENYCGQDFECKGPVCIYYPCMKTLTVSQAFEQVRKQLGRDV